MSILLTRVFFIEFLEKRISSAFVLVYLIDLPLHLLQSWNKELKPDVFVL